ncbi:microtubule-associated protein futsch-like [Dorcoceras hygrometricum]|uniref:Microtubule-associated protein futsch-like n=1 Tax=Dorcoceras hygrometricum TaxID=472368 RepID=A0A2Z7AF23_9LAMI|nr:microtubule-associated protein futsch-like [Dorcoceras hygrometricum]
MSGQEVEGIAARFESLEENGRKETETTNEILGRSRRSFKVPRSAMGLEEQVIAAGVVISQPTLSLDELLCILDQIEKLLLKVEQSPTKSKLDALTLLMNALGAEDFV